ncbi:MAG: toll/interleukin-1 receptor domain-containing protein [Clostridiales bacterium]|nr:toll/interleukin-1 receptor domain-containing protein [Clostridiales bacterium]
MKEKYRYDAFISYRHAPLDQYVAEMLHKKLEAFKLPGKMAQKVPEGERKNIRRVFRDRDELPLANNLAEPITRALEESEYLIVICTPRLPESRWCQREIETFIKLHGREKIFAVLAEGEPREAFPELLLYEEQERTLEDGTTVIERCEVEPLAADVRGETRKEIKRRIQEEILRLVAPMFHCGYDDLKQRHKEQRMKRILTSVLAGSAVCFCFGTVSTAMALRIHSQNTQIKAQNEQINSQSEKIEEQYRQSLKTQAGMSAREAERLLAAGDRVGAVELALSVLPDSKKNGDIPYTPEAEYALTKSLRLYENGRHILPERALEQDGIVDVIQASPTGEKLMTVAIDGTVIIWDPTNGERLCEVDAMDSAAVFSENEVGFLSEELFVHKTEDGFRIVRIKDGACISENDSGYVYDICVSPTGQQFMVRFGSHFTVYGSDNGAELFSAEAPEGLSFAENAAFSPDGRYLAVPLKSDDVMSAGKVLFYDTETGKKTSEIMVPEQDVEQIVFGDGELFVVSNQALAMDEFEFNAIIRGNLSCFPWQEGQTGTAKWSYVNEESRIREVRYAGVGLEKVFFVGYDTSGILDARNGRLLYSNNHGSEVVGMNPLEGTEIVALYTRDGEFQLADLDSGMCLYQEGKFASCSENVRDFVWIGKRYAAAAYLENRVIIYGYARTPEAETIAGLEKGAYRMVLSDDGRRLAVQSETEDGREHVSIYDTVKWEMLGEAEFDERIEHIFFRGSDLIVLQYHNMTCLDSETALRKQEITIEEMGDYKGHNADGSLLYQEEYENIRVIRTMDGTVEQTMEVPAAKAVTDASCVSPDHNYYVLASTAEKELQVYAFGDTKPSVCVPVHAAYVEQICMDDSEEEVFVTSKDGRVTVYDVDTLEKKREYTDIAHAVVRIQELPAGRLLCGENAAYLVGEEGEITACLYGFIQADAEKMVYYQKVPEGVSRVPVYSYEEIREEAKRQLSVEK